MQQSLSEFQNKYHEFKGFQDFLKIRKNVEEISDDSYYVEVPDQASTCRKPFQDVTTEKINRASHQQNPEQRKVASSCKSDHQSLKLSDRTLNNSILSMDSQAEYEQK